MIQITDTETRRKLIEHLSQFVTEPRKARLEEVLNNRTRHITVVLEDLYQTQNISAVMRSCECYGIQDAYIVENRNEFEIHKDISMGADKWLTLHHYPHAEHNMKQCIDDLHAKGYTVVATLPDEKKTTIQDLPIDRKTAFLFGTELTGLSEEAVRYADCNALIPMYGFTESFNISNSAAIILSNFSERLRHSDVDWHLGEDEREALYFDWLQKSIRDPEAIIRHYLATHP
ncbi:MAG: RNA methyltransferase [Bacteroidales bacterium]|nr:RNA methyltransferase [Bacteroidales bacterium]MBR3573294.1 RNA methyltransferase [Bacteroidales bacterium]